MPLYLIVADESSLTELEVGLATLPLCSRGRVFVEVQHSSQIEFLAAPPRMTITWFVRESARQTTPPGITVGRAVAAWASEMLCGDDSRAQPWLLGADSTVAPVRELLSRPEVPSAPIMTAAAFRL